MRDSFCARNTCGPSGTLHGSIEPLTVGNSAKLYCLRWIEKFVVAKPGETTILDLGCGEALNFVKLLKLYPQIRYVGIEPSKQSCLQAQTYLGGLKATVVNCYAYDIHKTLQEEFDLVVSFSVLEHVFRRMDYLRSARECLKESGYFLTNYDAGHFLSPTITTRLKDALRFILARLGAEQYYQSFVKEPDFLSMIDEVGFRIIEAQFFNAHSLKGIYKVVPESRRFDYMDQWLEFELGLNELGIGYTDSLASLFGTRNFILAHK